MFPQQTPSEITVELTYRARAMLRAVEGGRARVSLSCEPDLFVDGLQCCDQQVAHDLARAGLLRPAHPGRVGERVRAVLTGPGRSACLAFDRSTGHVVAGRPGPVAA